MQELDALHTNLEESAQGMHSAHEMKAQSDTQLVLLQKQMDELQKEREMSISQLRKKHADQLQVRHQTFYCNVYVSCKPIALLFQKYQIISVFPFRANGNTNTRKLHS